MHRGAAEVEAVEAEAARAVPVAAVRVAQAREPVVAQAQQAERVRARRPEERNRDQALEMLAKEEEPRTLAGQVIPLTEQTGRFRDALRHRIRLQHPERTGSTARRRLKGAHGRPVIGIGPRRLGQDACGREAASAGFGTRDSPLGVGTALSELAPEQSASGSAKSCPKSCARALGQRGSHHPLPPRASRRGA